MKVLVYHRDALFVDSMRAALDSDDLQVIGAESIDQVFAASSAADSCLIDARCDTGLDALRTLSAAGSPARTFGLVDSGDRQQIMAVIAAGVDGWVTTSDGFDQLVRIVRNGEGGTGCDRAAVGRGARMPMASQALTARESEVLSGLAEGASTKELAARLGVSPVTARSHVHNVLAKLGVHTRLQAVAYAVDHRLVEIGAEVDNI